MITVPTMNSVTTRQAQMALAAVELRRTCGAYAARRFAHKQGRGVFRLYTLACQLEVVQ